MKLSFAVLLVCANAVFAAVGPSSTPTRIIAGSGVTVVTNSAASFTISASGGVGTSNGFATNLSVYSSGTTNRPLRIYGTNGEAIYVTKDGNLVLSNPASSSLAVAPIQFGALGAINYNSGAAEMEFWVNTALSASLDYEKLHLASAYPLVWGAGTPTGAADTALRRYAAGVLGVDSSTSGAYRDLRLRTLLTYAQGSDPASSATFGQLYAKTNGATTEVYVMDGAGNVTQISPHARASSPAPASVDAGDKTPIVIHHKNVFTGEQEWLHLSAMARKLEQITGEKFVWKRRIPDAEVRDWDVEQARLEAESDDDVKADRKRLREWEQITSPNKGPAPAVREKYRRAHKPDFLK